MAHFGNCPIPCERVQRLSIDNENNWMLRARLLFLVAASLLVLLSSGCVANHTVVSGPTVSPTAEEEILFFLSPASMSPDGQYWSLTVQGRIFNPTVESKHQADLIDAIAVLDGHEKATPLFLDRANYFLSHSDKNGRVSIRIGAETFPLVTSDSGGYFAAQIVLAKEMVEKLANNGAVAFQSSPTAANSKVFSGVVILVPEEGLSVVTDMDDTIKDSHVLDRTELLKNTFVREFKVIPYMPELYRSWKQALGARIQFHVVSAGPWQLYDPLQAFTQSAKFPAFTWHMRSVDINSFTPAHLEELKLQPSVLYDFKVRRIEELMRQFPKRHFVFVGDSGEMDPEVYAYVLRECPGRVDAVFIHNVSERPLDVERQQLFPPNVAAKFRVFGDPRELPALDTFPAAHGLCNLPTAP